MQILKNTYEAQGLTIAVNMDADPIKGLAAAPAVEGDSPNRIEDCLRELRRAKAYLWHGSPHRALRTLDELTWDIGTESSRASALQEKLDEFMNYISTNVPDVPKLRRSSSARRADCNWICRVRRQPGSQQAACQEAANEVDTERRTSTAAGQSPWCSIQQLRGDFERWYPQLQSLADPGRLAA